MVPMVHNQRPCIRMFLSHRFLADRSSDRRNTYDASILPPTDTLQTATISRSTEASLTVNGMLNSRRYPGPGPGQKLRNCVYRNHGIAVDRELAGVIYGSARCVRSCSPYDLIGFNYTSLKVTAAACVRISGGLQLRAADSRSQTPRSALLHGCL